MREWQKGEIKKFGLAARVLIVLGASVACVANFDHDLREGILAGGMCVAGIAFAIYLILYERRTRKSAKSRDDASA